MKSVLIVRTDSIGDFILWLDAAKELKHLYPPNEYRITLLANQEWVDLAKSYPYWDEVITVDRDQFASDFIYRWIFLRKIYTSHYDRCIHPIFSRIFTLGDAIVRISASRERVGWAIYESPNPGIILKLGKWLMRSWYSRLIPWDSLNLMELERNSKFLHFLGLKDFKPHVPKLVREFASKPLQDVSSEYFAIVPDALWRWKEWPLENFIEIGKRIQKQTNWKMVFLGKRDALAEYFKAAPVTNGLINRMGWTTLAEYVQILGGAKLVFTNDSSAAHIAAALNVPAFCIAGGGDWGRFVPYPSYMNDDQNPVVINEAMDCYHCGWICKFDWKKGPVKCIGAISVTKAWDIISNSAIFDSDPIEAR